MEWTVPAWFVLFVRAQQEDRIKRLLEIQVGDQFQYVVPKRTLRERKDGQWRQVERKLFPGYILINGILTAAAYHQMKKVPDILRFLKDESTVLTLRENELKVLKSLLNPKDDTVGISTLFKERDKIQVVSGPLLGLEGLIVSVNPRKGRAKVRLSLASQDKVVELGVEMVQALPPNESQ